jgi:pyruvate dehydrogenase E2 component (dihydrolipoamide acetyltransferase)
MSTTIDVKVPDIGGFKDVAVIDVLVKAGDRIDLDTPLATLETEKATMDIPSTAAGVVETVHVKKGGAVNEGDLVVSVRADAASTPAPTRAPAAASQSSAAASTVPSAPTPTPAPARAPAAAVVEPPGAATPLDSTAARRALTLAPIDEPGFSRAHASPSVRKFARELGVDLSRVTGSGPKGRITHDDVKAHVKQRLSGATISAGVEAPAVSGGGALPAVPAVDFAQFGPIEVRPLGRVQKIAGPRLHASWVNLPHVTQFDQADITDLEQLREKLKTNVAKNVKLTPLAFILRACVRVLQQFPLFNASLDAARENIVFKRYFHVGFAADTPQGLLVPVVRDADRKDVYELARALGELAEKARAGKLAAADMQGGTFTISSLGGIGGTAFTPIINAPEVAILGVSRASTQAVFRDGVFVPRLLLPLSLSYDHRVIDGAAAARFTTALAQQLADPRGLLEAVP